MTILEKSSTLNCASWLFLWWQIDNWHYVRPLLGHFFLLLEAYTFDLCPFHLIILKGHFWEPLCQKMLTLISSQVSLTFMFYLFVTTFFYFRYLFKTQLFLTMCRKSYPTNHKHVMHCGHQYSVMITEKILIFFHVSCIVKCYQNVWLR